MKKKLWKDEEKRDSVYRDLAPINSIKPEEESIRALRWAIKNPNVHNIALSGPYGSGKSSVIQSYLAYYDISNIYKIFECVIPSKLSGILKIFPKSSKKNLRISLATFDESDENNIEKDELQRGILKQLFYKVDASRIPLSRYRKLHHIKWYRYVIAVTLIILLIVSGIYLKSPEDTCNFFIHYLEGLSKKEIIMRGGIALFLVGGISYLLWVCTSRFRIKSITVGDVTAEGKGTEEESILDQNIDEILYFFEKTKYKVVAMNDIVDTVSLKKLYSKGEIITLGSGKCIVDTNDGQMITYSNGVQVSKGIMNEEGIISVDENGQLEMTGIPLGKYQVVEVSCPQGYVLDSTPYDFEITQKDHTTTIYTNSHEQTNQITKTTFTKTDVTGDQEVSGAKMSITDLEGKVIDEWISSNKAHEIDGLESGKTYYLNEDTSPAGYVKATKIEFKVNEDGKIQKVNMKDKVVTISKVTLGGEEIQGALLQVIDEEGNTVDQWYSDGNEHPVSGLEEGKTYTLHEDLAPLGFNLVNDISFTVSYEKENQKIEMIDTFVKVYKQKEDGNLLKGAQLTVVSTKTKNRIDQWITGQHIFDINDVMKKKLLKGDMCQGKNEEGIEYKVVPQLKSNDYFLMLKDGEDVTYYCIDIQGDETAHLIQGLNSGEKYILRETLTPCGYATAKEQIFEIREKNIVLKVVDEDIKVDISKKDITNKKELSGAHLQVKNEDGEVLDSWISTDQEHRICHLKVGKKYILEETMAPYGYEKSEKVEFVIKDTGEIQKVIMYDQPIIQAIKTGDSSKLNYFIMLGALSGICIFLCRKRDVKSPKSK